MFLLGAFALFVVAVLVLPGRVASALGSITATADLRAEPIEGTVLLQDPDDFAWKQLREAILLTAGSRIATDATSRAFLELFDGSTVYLYNNTEFLIERSARGWLRHDVKQLQFRIDRGRAIFGVASTADETQRRFWLYANQGRMEFVEGSYLVELLADERTEVLVRSGEALLSNGGELAKVGLGGRGGYTADIAPSGDLPPTSPLLKDSEACGFGAGFSVAVLCCHRNWNRRSGYKIIVWTPIRTVHPPGIATLVTDSAGWQPTANR